MKILAFSDLHLDEGAAREILSRSEDVDLFLGVGDFAQRREGLAGYMALLEPIAERAIYVPGNNETEDELRSATSARVLHGEAVTVGNLTVGGIGGAIPPLPPMPWGSYDLTEQDAAQKLAAIGAADILMSHSPPKGVADVLTGRGSIGSVSVREAVERLAPRYLFCGHVHDCWGQGGTIGGTEIRNLGPRGLLFEVSP